MIWDRNSFPTRIAPAGLFSRVEAKRKRANDFGGANAINIILGHASTWRSDTEAARVQERWERRRFARQLNNHLPEGRPVNSQ